MKVVENFDSHLKICLNLKKFHQILITSNKQGLGPQQNTTTWKKMKSNITQTIGN